MTRMMKKNNQINTSLLREDHDHHNKKKNKKKIIGNSSCSTSNSNSNSNSTPKPEHNLTKDLILEIFSHLPPISLLRFKTVSKSLHSLISNPDFLRRNAVHQFRRRLNSSPPPPPGILLKRQYCSGDSKILIFPSPLQGDYDDDDDRQHYYYSYQLLQNLIHYLPEDDQPPNSNNDRDQKVKFMLIDSCNGLLLYLNCVSHRNPPGGKCIWYVCNPITEDYIKLPPLEEQGLNILEYSLANLVFDPSLSLTYKVVIWLRCRYNYYLQEHYRLYVYSSKTRSWRLSVSINEDDFPFQVLQEQFSFEYRAMLLNGVLYWNTLVDANMDVSLCYDVEKNSVWTLKFPKMSGEYFWRELLYFGVCGGGLRLIENYYKLGDRIVAFPCSFDVMEMNELQLQQQQQHHQDQDCNIDRELWTVKYHVNIGEEGYYANLIKEASMLGVYILDLYKTTTKAGGGEGEEVLMCINDRLLISFSLSDNTFRKELRSEMLFTKHSFGFTDVLRYAISLFPL